MTIHTATAYRVIVPNAYGGGGIHRDHYPFGTTRDDAYAVAARIPGAYVEVSANGVTGWTDDAPAAPRAPRRYTARRIAARFYEYTVDGLTPSDDPDAFNVDATPYAVEDDVMTFDSVADMVATIRRDGVSFDAYGDGVTASDPDGSYVIDYATGAREAVSWHFDGIAPALIERVIAPAIEAR